ncbi:hypothetical protein GALMADRAFT_269195 [Galerina marginata CBS 339.88]|uniref:Uncharacterized protein n=1 Tax=Galerina marginata (strain CBS 339.88) TaxID=685588 RepID=A0A067T2U1_GALM3|nr:hypothetical protein GALMADRAFT_269195 [Galerina marginata CBS 339.88]
MNVSVKDLNAQTVNGSILSNSSFTHSEHHVHHAAASEDGGTNSIHILFSQINAVVTRPQIFHLDQDLRKSARRAALEIPDLPVIESIVARFPPERHIFGRGYGHCKDWKATTAEISQIKEMVQDLLDPNVDEGVPFWQTLSRRFESLGARFAALGWFIGSLRMSYHGVEIRCALATFWSQSISTDISNLPVSPTDRAWHMETLGAIAKLLHHRSMYAANEYCFNDARRASKQAIQIQSELHLHDTTNEELKSTLSQMQKHLSTFNRQDAAYNIVVSRSIGKALPIPADVTDFDIARGRLRQMIEVLFSMGAMVSLLTRGPRVAVPVFATGWGIGEYISSINRRS